MSGWMRGQILGDHEKVQMDLLKSFQLKQTFLIKNNDIDSIVFSIDGDEVKTLTKEEDDMSSFWE